MRTPRLATEDSHYHIKRRRDKGGNRILSPVKIENVEGGRPQSVVADGCSSCQTSHQLRGRKGEELNSNHSFLTPSPALAPQRSQGSGNSEHPVHRGLLLGNPSKAEDHTWGQKESRGCRRIGESSVVLLRRKQDV